MNGARFDFIADTSAIIHLLRRDQQVEKQVAGKNFAIVFVTLAELDVGLLKGRKRVSDVQRFREVLANLQVYNGSGMTPLFYAHIYHDLEQCGQLIPVNDIWIASVALETGLPILARDEHFSRVQGLSVIQC